MWDAIVIGGRCSGAATAMLLARHGHRVLVLDRAELPSDTLSTHFLWPHGASYLQRWGLLDEIKRKTPFSREIELVQEGIALRAAIDVRHVAEQLELLHGDAGGAVDVALSVRRSILDGVVLKGAERAGVEIRTGCAVEELQVQDGTVTGVVARDGAGQRFVEQAKLVVGADGRSSFVAKTLGLPKYDQRLRCTFAYWSYFEGLHEDIPRLHRRGRLATAAVSTNDSRTMVLVWGPGEWFSAFRRSAAANFQRALDFVHPQLGAELRESGTRAERFYGAVDQAAYLRKLSGPGWVLVGDAACFKDQCTATGMTHAFRDAELASAAMHQHLSGQASFTDAMRVYEQRRRSQQSAAYYDYVCTLAEMKPLRHDELLLHMALRSNRQEASRYLAVHADIAPVADFFQASNLLQLLEGARETTSDHPIFKSFAAATKHYNKNLFSEPEITIGGVP